MLLGPLTLTASLFLAAIDPRATLFSPREIEFPFDDALRLPAGQINGGKLWRSHGLPDDGSAVPLVIFVHGIIFDGQRHHWLTVDPAGPWDARPFMERLVDDGRITPLVVAVPSQVRDGIDPSKLFVGLDFDDFVDRVDRELSPYQRVDRQRIVVVGHSGSACNPDAAAYASLSARTFTVRALFSIDGCMSNESAQLLATTTHARDVVVAYQDMVWERPFGDFLATYRLSLARTHAPGIRAIDRFDGRSDGLAAENAHLEVVERTMERWLPMILPPERPPIDFDPSFGPTLAMLF